MNENACIHTLIFCPLEMPILIKNDLGVQLCSTENDLLLEVLDATHCLVIHDGLKWNFERMIHILCLEIWYPCQSNTSMLIILADTDNTIIVTSVVT